MWRRRLFWRGGITLSREFGDLAPVFVEEFEFTARCTATSSLKEE
jgi:hypothetical protein